MKSIIDLRTLFLLILFTTSVIIYGNNTSKFRTLNMDNGLVHTDVTCITQDNSGLIWIGTNGGLQSFDGYNLQTYKYYNDNDRIRLLHDRITSIEADSCSLWVATESGLLKFDYNLGKYIDYSVSKELEILHHSRVKKVKVLRNNTMFVLTSDSLFVVSEREGSLYPVRFDKYLNSMKNAHTITESAGFTWLCTAETLIQLKITNEEVIKVKTYSCRDLSMNDEQSSSLFIKDNFLYLRIDSGCIRYLLEYDGSLNMERYDYYDFNLLDPRIPKNTSGKIIVDNKNTIWCSSRSGLLEISNTSGMMRAKIHSRESFNITSVNSNFLSTIFIDSFNNIWVGTWGSGLNYKSLSMPMFGTISDSSDEGDLRIKGAFVKDIDKDSKGNLWILTQRQGLNLYSINKGLLFYTDFSELLGKGTIFKSMRLSQDEKKIYVGLIKGLISYDIENDKANFLVFPSKSSPINDMIDVSDIVYDGNGVLWVATWNKGIYCFKEKDDSLVLLKILNSNNYLKSDCVPQLFYDEHKNEMLVSSRQGIVRFLLDNDGLNFKKVVSYSVDKNKKNSLSNNFIASIDRQNDSIYWVGTLGGGLNRVVFVDTLDNAYSATSFMVQDGMMSNDSEIVLVDKNENVWIGGYGIVKYDTHTGLISRYDYLDGLQSNYFKYGSYYKGKDGILYMGGVRGLNYFYPHNVQMSKGKYKLYLSNLYIHGKRVNAGEPLNGVVTLPMAIDKLDKLELHHDQNDFAIEFSALGYNLSNRIVYRYRLKGYESDWRVVSVSTNSVLYSNLDYNTYTFELMYSTDNGQTWNEDIKSLIIDILPPWWLSPWAKITYLVLIASLIMCFFYLYVKELNMKHKISLHEIEKKKDEENHQLKLQFFMNISHEFKTPLTIIISSIERMEREIYNIQMSQAVSESLKSISRNANKLLSLITELVDFRKSDLNISSLNLKEDSMDRCVSMIVNEFSPWAQRKNIELKLDVDSPAMMVFDQEKVSMILTNLLSNAIKYTSEGGRVDVTLKTGKDIDIKPKFINSYQVGDTIWGEDVCVIRVSDTGIGISSESISKIYDRFFQVKNNTSAHLGSGIGLAIAKNMVLLHHGNIIVSSERMKGTEFIVTIPINGMANISDAGSDFDVREFLHNAHIEYNYIYDDDVEKNVVEIDDSKQTLLIVEDNIELVSLLKAHFVDRFNVITALDGEMGLKYCNEYYPDLIISDVMMPKMDGIEMCKAIRNNLSIAYTPIIMLTAKSTVENQIEGYESGADLYLPKPFSVRILELNVDRLLEIKSKMIRQEDGNNNVEGHDEGHDDGKEQVIEELVTRKTIKEEKDKEFIDRLNNFLNENISNPDLSVDMLCRELGIGRTRLYSTVKEVSGQSLGDFIRDMRLNKAAYLLKHTDMNITEIIYETGFGSNSHFSKVFKSKFGVTPSDFAKQ